MVAMPHPTSSAGMTHRGEIRVSNKLDGIWPITYPTVQIDVPDILCQFSPYLQIKIKNLLVTSSLLYIPRSSFMPLKNALLILLWSIFFKKYPILAKVKMKASTLNKSFR